VGFFVGFDQMRNRPMAVFISLVLGISLLGSFYRIALPPLRGAYIGPDSDGCGDPGAGRPRGCSQRRSLREEASACPSILPFSVRDPQRNSYFFRILTIRRAISCVALIGVCRPQRPETGTSARTLAIRPTDAAHKSANKETRGESRCLRKTRHLMV
jgi:hypothetical protein